jgi:hypothetical protein
MTHQSTQSELQHKTQQLLQGPLKHIKAAALAAALLPLASVAAAPASAQDVCPSGGVCGTVFDDANNDGVFQEGTEGVLEGVKVFVCVLCDGTDTIETETGPDGTFALFVEGGQTATISVLIPTGSQASPPNVGDDGSDSDGVPDGGGFSVVTHLVDHTATDFGFFTPAVEQPGTGTPGYWKNHPEAWPVASITVGGVTYTKAQAISWLKKVGKDKTTTMFSSLVPAMLNVMIGNDGSCVNPTIAAANAWMATHGPVGSGVHASSAAWTDGEPLHIILDNYNNGRLCAPHRD